VRDILTILGAQKRIDAESIYPDPRFPPSMYYRFLRLVAQHFKPRVSVELGVCGGGASLHMALGNPDGQVIGVDVTDAYPDNLNHLRQTYPNFRFWCMDSVDAVGVYAKIDLGEVDLLFIDTVHTYERTMMEFRCWEPWLSDRAIVCLDDLFRGGMDRAWTELPGRKLRMDWLHIGGVPTDGGFGVIYDIKGDG
jgi:predicted O-methyltransferase YrrM